ncbi:MAG: hypothetical protein EBR02_03920 [Alphaproteobacteria bacterium]|nr:hypothetical protein [Alphaproteobacteria bacterium]
MVVGAFLPPASGIAWTATALLSAYIGGASRKEDIELENKNGKATSAPTLFNEHFFSGFNKSMLIGGLASLGIAAAAAVGALTVTPTVVILNTVASLGAPVVGAIAGIVTAFSGKARMEKEYNAALEMEKAKAQGHGRAPSVEISQEPSKSQFVQAEVERRLAQSNQKGLGA